VALDVGSRDRRNGGGERAQVKVGGAVGIQRVYVDCPPVDVGHAGRLALLGRRTTVVQVQVPVLGALVAARALWPVVVVVVVVVVEEELW
jgi:hypothetical protein